MKKNITNLASYLNRLKPNHLILTLFVLLMGNFTAMACDCDAPPNNLAVATTTTEVIFNANKSYSWACGCYGLQVEIKPVGQSFDGSTNLFTSNAGCISQAGAQALNPVIISLSTITSLFGPSQIKWRVRQTGNCFTGWTESSQFFFAGNPGKALHFDGADDFVAVNNPFTNFTNEITVEWWVNPASFVTLGSGIGQSTIGVDNMNSNVWLMHFNGSGTSLNFYVNDNGNWRTHNAVNIGTGWHHVVGVASAASTKLYVDGVLVSTGAGISSGIKNNPNSVMHFGKDVRWNTGRFMQGSIDEVRIWNRALCGGEILNYKNCELNGLQNGLVSYYKFNHGFINSNNSTETTLADLSGNNRNGTLNNFALTGSTSNWVAGNVNGTCSQFVSTPPTITASGPTTFCQGGFVTLTASSGTSYLWSNGATTQSIQVNQAGTFSVTVTDNGSCSGTSSSVTTQVNPLPIFSSCPSNISLNATSNTCGAVANYSAIANVSSENVSYQYSGATTGSGNGTGSGNVFNVGITTVTINASNSCGTQTCSFNVTVNDNQLPTITCPFNISVNATQGNCGAVVNYNTPAATDNCGTGNLPTSLTGFTYKGTFEGHTYFLSNAMALPEDAHETAVALGGHLATISSAAENAFVSSLSPNYMWIGFTDRDVEGTFKWVTNEPVTYTNWAPGEPNNAGNEDWAVINWGGSAKWNDWLYTVSAYYVVEFDGGTVPTSLVSGLGSGATFPIGTSTETWKAVDASGNISTCSFTVTVIDNQNPVISCPSNINVNATSAAGAVVNYNTPVGTDNCTATTTRTAGLASGSAFPNGTTTVTHQVVDGSGNVAQCSFTVTVIACNSPSFANHNSYIQANTNAINCQANVTYALSVSGTTPTVTYSFSGATSANGGGTGSGATFNVGVTNVTVTATNNCGSVNSAFTVTVVDNVPPNAICKPHTLYLNNNGSATLNINDLNNGSNDNCGPVTLSIANTGTICATATEGNSLTLTAPQGAVITSIDFASYGNPNGSCGNFTQGWCHAANSVSIVSNLALNKNTVTIQALNSLFGDPCGGTVKRLYVQATYSGFGSGSISCSSLGNNNVVLKVTDAAGNVATCSSVVTVIDNILPVITCPSNIAVNATSANGTTVNYNTPIGTDNCTPTTTRIAGLASGSTFPIGTTTVTHKVTDASGNIAQCSFTVTVTGLAPQIVCPANITVNNANGQCGTNVTFAATEIVGIPASTITYSHVSGGFFPVGTTTIT
ncbi:MAG: HYR domain-containing protein, partial [Bacteroidetes bacterium]|nr:HYR domain-containing protein [Bacteroidota bacterium]